MTAALIHSSGWIALSPEVSVAFDHVIGRPVGMRFNPPHVAHCIPDDLIPPLREELAKQSIAAEARDAQMFEKVREWYSRQGMNFQRRKTGWGWNYVLTDGPGGVVDSNMDLAKAAGWAINNPIAPVAEDLL